MKSIYLDNAATTQIDEEVLSEMMPFLTFNFGNPSSQHAMGWAAMEAVEKARTRCALALGVEPEEIFFTSGGSEGNSYILNNFNSVCCTNIEHHSIIENSNIKTKINALSNDLSNLEDILLNNGSTLLSMQLINNEIGSIQDVKRAASIAHNIGVAVHTDAVQAMGHVPVNPIKLGVDFMTISGHKIHAPKGTGCIFANLSSQPLLHKNLIIGSQEFGRRGGTENVAGIVGFGKAMSLASNRVLEDMKLYECLSDYFYQCLDNKDKVHINNPSNSIKNILSIRLDGVDSSQLIEYLSENEIYISSMSACDSSNGEPSHVLKALGLTDEECENTIRISLCRNNTLLDMKNCAEAINTFRKMVG